MSVSQRRPPCQRSTVRRPGSAIRVVHGPYAARKAKAVAALAAIGIEIRSTHP